VALDLSRICEETPVWAFNGFLKAAFTSFMVKRNSEFHAEVGLLTDPTHLFMKLSLSCSTAAPAAVQQAEQGSVNMSAAASA